MDYKKIFKSRQLRFRILKMLSRIPDASMIRLQYKIKMGFFPDLKNPKRFTEKLQLYKLKYHNPLMTICVDKLRVRDYIKSKNLNIYLPELYGVYDRGEDIDFKSLPEKFVIKTNDGGGGNNVIICKDKSKLNIKETISKLNSWLNTKSINPGREWAYSGIPKSVLIVEEFLENDKDPEAGLDDIKFYCFNGHPFTISDDRERYKDHKRNFYDTEWNNIHVSCDYHSIDTEIPKPENLEDMLKLAAELSKDFPFVRVDLYTIKNKIYFGELTFYPGSGYIKFVPDKFDFDLGREFDITSFVNNPIE